MSQLGYTPTPPSKRRAEAEAIYQLLKLINEDLKRDRQVREITLEGVVHDGQWRQLSKVVTP